jgi:hypothetical protein
VGNTCAPTAIAAGLSILFGYKITLQDVQPAFPTTYIGIGIPPKGQAAMINLFDPRVSAKFTQGNRVDLLDNLNNGLPTVISIAFPITEGAGHALLVIGYDPDIDQILFFDPANEDIVNEALFRNRYGDFDFVWTNNSNAFIPDGSMVTIQMVTSPTLPIPMPSSGMPGIMIPMDLIL